MSSVSILAVLLVIGMAVVSAEPGGSAPKVGDKAPSFKLRGSDGKDYSLEELKGKKAVVIAWYPVAFTGG